MINFKYFKNQNTWWYEYDNIIFLRTYRYHNLLEIKILCLIHNKWQYKITKKKKNKSSQIVLY